jgi:5-methylcytosine-specific restriction endonuclease McrA
MQDQSTETRTCSRCGIDKPAAAFSTHWRKRWCKRCYADAELARNRRHGMQPARRAEHDSEGRRKCSLCGVFKPIDQFARARKKTAKLHPYCKQCLARRMNHWRAAHLQRARASVRAAWASSAGRYRVTHRRWDMANADRIAMYRGRRRARRKHAEMSKFSASEWHAVQELSGHRCAYCWRVTDRLEQDHIRPLSRGGAHALSNIVPACRSCNAQKHSKTLLEFLLTVRRSS